MSTKCEQKRPRRDEWKLNCICWLKQVGNNAIFVRKKILKVEWTSREWNKLFEDRQKRWLKIHKDEKKNSLAGFTMIINTTSLKTIALAIGKRKWYKKPGAAVHGLVAVVTKKVAEIKCTGRDGETADDDLVIVVAHQRGWCVKTLFESKVHTFQLGNEDFGVLLLTLKCLSKIVCSLRSLRFINEMHKHLGGDRIQTDVSMQLEFHQYSNFQRRPKVN